MNFYTVASKMRKQVKKDLMDFMNCCTDDNLIEQHHKRLWDNAMIEHEKTVTLGLELMDAFKERLGTSKGSSWNMLTVRPPHDCEWSVFKASCDSFIDKWKNKWMEFEYVFEQKGNSPESMGKGFHWHLILQTETKNYYKSHIVRDAQRCFTYVAANCIQVDCIRNLGKCKEYIRGHKSEDKLEAVKYDTLWRQKMGLEEIYSCNGQVQAVTIIEDLCT